MSEANDPSSRVRLIASAKLFRERAKNGPMTDDQKADVELFIKMECARKIKFEQEGKDDMFPFTIANLPEKHSKMRNWTYGDYLKALGSTESLCVPVSDETKAEAETLLNMFMDEIQVELDIAGKEQDQRLVMLLTLVADFFHSKAMKLYDFMEFEGKEIIGTYTLQQKLMRGEITHEDIPYIRDNEEDLPERLNVVGEIRISNRTYCLS